MHKKGHSRGFLGRLLWPLQKTGSSLMKNILKLLAKSVLILLGLAATASPTDAAIHKDIFGSGITIFIISNEEKSDVMKIVQSLVKFGLLIKGVSKTIKKEAMKQKSGFLTMFRYIRF